MMRGLTTVRYHTTDLAAAKRWYTELLGIEPYFDRPEYAEFRLGDYQHELGLLDSRYSRDLGQHDSSTTGPAGAVVYWHVDDVPVTLARLLSMGAKQHEAPRDFGRGFIGASVIDPLGTSWASCTTRTTWRFWARPEKRNPRRRQATRYERLRRTDRLKPRLHEIETV